MIACCATLYSDACTSVHRQRMLSASAVHAHACVHYGAAIAVNMGDSSAQQRCRCSDAASAGPLPQAEAVCKHSKCTAALHFVHGHTHDTQQSGATLCAQQYRTCKYIGSSASSLSLICFLRLEASSEVAATSRSASRDLRMESSWCILATCSGDDEQSRRSTTDMVQLSHDQPSHKPVTA